MLKFNIIYSYQKFLILLALLIFNFDIDAVNFDKAGATKLTFINKNSDAFNININFNLFDSRNFSTFSQTQSFVLNSKDEFLFDVSVFQNNLDITIQGNNDQPADEDAEQLKKIFGCIKTVQVINQNTNKEAKLYVYGLEDSNLKIFILDSNFVNGQFDCFHINFNAAIDSKSEYYHHCVNNIDQRYPNGNSSKSYRLALDSWLAPADFIERMKFLYERYFVIEPDGDNLNNILLGNDSKVPSRINKCLFQIWIGEKPMSDEYQKNQLKWKSILPPEWTYKLYTDEDVKKLKFSSPESKKTYNALPNAIAQSDLLRMEILNKYGGVYVDLDTEPFEPLDFFVLNFDFFGVLYGPTRGSLFIDTYFLGSIPEHPIIKQTIQNIILLFSDRSSLNHMANAGKISPNVLTSIIPLTRAVYQHAGRYETRDIILPVKYFNNYSTTIFSYGTHYPKRMWKK